MPPAARARRLLVYDGDCGICREWVEYWLALTGGSFEARTYQDAAAEFPGIPPGEFRRAIQLIETDGSVSSGAEATYRLYDGIRPYSMLIFFYRWFPGFRQLSEFAYGFLSRRRGLLAGLTHLFWGRGFQPVRYTVTTGIFLRLLGLIYLGAFVSFGVQASGLIGSEGILPLQNYLAALSDHLGDEAWYRAPTLFWLSGTDTAVRGAWIAGCLLSVFLVSGILVRLSLVGLYLLYLSLFYAGQVFMTFQWDLLLLEAGFLAIFLPSGGAIVPWLFRWLAFRFMFLGGAVKIASGDPAWDNLTALKYHFETQPLPTPVAWYAHQLPDGLLMALVATTFIVELIVPFLIFAPRRMRMFAGWCFIVFQAAIILTGNYNFFNLLTICILLFLFDDAALSSLFPAHLRARLARLPARRPQSITTVAQVLFAALILCSSAESLVRVLSSGRDTPLSALSRAISPCQCVNVYGPFAVMTTQRREIVIEGSADGLNWREYEFRYKPGALSEIPGWIIPHQPRLDWQMWFAALSRPDRQPWFRNLLARLLLGNQPVLRLLASNPFPGSSPMAVRAIFYRYRFTTPEERAAGGNWWQRERLGEYHPAIRITHKS
ncbi:MAG: lipase maturation factor family protein [Gammaproteobacteria bacterium]|nr:lipase maturation factor family protein [Gammaproteobacteria bacterium]